MKICDRCPGAVKATDQVVLVNDDERHDICEKCADEIRALIATKIPEKKKGLFSKK